VGQYALYARALLPGLRLQYHCKDLPPQAGAGREFVSDGRFHADEACLERTYDVVMACGSLHYTQAWQPLLGRLAGATADSLYLAHVPTVRVVPSFIFIQRPYRYGYRTEYLGWCLNRDEVVAAAGSSGLKLVREFVYGYRPQIQSAPEQNEYRGYLFQPARAASD
jgi:putative methyltransferase (TIGR04325 family)